MMSSKEAELDQTRYLLEVAEQARNDVRNSLLESAENLKSNTEKEKTAKKLIIEESKKLSECNETLNEKHEIGVTFWIE